LDMRLASSAAKRKTTWLFASLSTGTGSFFGVCGSVEGAKTHEACWLGASRTGGRRCGRATGGLGGSSQIGVAVGAAMSGHQRGYDYENNSPKYHTRSVRPPKD